MTQTEQYKLSQWEKSDRILMEDFNSDNAKIEAALAGKLGCLEILRHRPSTNELVFDGSTSVVGLDWANLNLFAILVTFPPVPDGEEANICSIRFADVLVKNTKTIYLPQTPTLYLFLPQRDPSKKVSVLIFADKTYHVGLEFPYSDFDTINIHSLNFAYKIMSPDILFIGAK